MQLESLRKALKKYEDKSIFKAFFPQEKEAYILIQNFVKTLADKPDNYYLNDGELFELLKILIVKNTSGLVKLIKKAFNRENVFEIANLLKKYGLLEQIIFWKIYDIEDEKRLFLSDILSSFDKMHFTISSENLILLTEKKLTQDATEIFKALAKASLLNNEYLKQLFSLQNSIFQHACKAIMNLHRKRLLNETAFVHVLGHIPKLPSASQSIVIKKSKKDTGKKKSEFIIDSTFSFFNDTEEYDSGACGQIKKGYDDSDGSNIIYGIKKLDCINEGKTAKREVKYHKLLGRNAFYYQHNKNYYVVSPWQSEKQLDYFERDEIQQFPLQQRLQWLISGLKQLNIFHENYRVHGDVKYDNCILNPKEGTLNLIDFGATRKIANKDPDFPYTSAFLDNRWKHFSIPYDFYDDIFGMGFIAAYVFPELYENKDIEHKVVITLIKSPFTVFESAIVALVDAMMHTDKDKRCCAKDALNYCLGLAEHFENLDKVILKKISLETIHRPHLTVDDVLHSKLSASKRR